MPMYCRFRESLKRRGASAAPMEAQGISYYMGVRFLSTGIGRHAAVTRWLCPPFVTPASLVFHRAAQFLVFLDFRIHRGAVESSRWCPLKADLDDQLASFSAFCAVGWVIRPVKTVHEMTYNVSSGTLTHSLTGVFLDGSVVFVVTHGPWYDARSRCAPVVQWGVAVFTANSRDTRHVVVLGRLFTQRGGV